MDVAKPDEATIFTAARQILDSAARGRYVREACGDDIALADRIQALLRAHEEDPTFLASPTKELGELLGTINEAGTLAFGPATNQGSTTLPPAPAGYEILGELGRGGMGVVYKARQTGLNRLVALKMILAGSHAGPEELARFRTEAEAVASLHHPNIVQIYEVHECDGLPYFSLELVEGGTLADRLKGAPAPARVAAELVATLARALQYAHSRGVIHRDLKPANVLIAEKDSALSQADAGRSNRSPTAQPLPKITDFGLAKQIDSAGGRTRTGAIMGTPSYMAPEQADGRSKAIGPACDIYALGAILYELLTGRPPFHAETPLETLREVIGDDPVPPRRLVPKLPRDLETICLKCLEKAPAKRYADAGALADDLSAFLAGQPVNARPTSTLERTAKWVKRQPTLAALLAVSASALVVLIAGIVLHNASLEGALQETQTHLRKARIAEEHAHEAKVDAVGEADRNRRLRYSSDVHLASQFWQGEEGTAAQCKELLLAHVPELGLPDLREFSWRYQWRLLHPDSVVRLPTITRVAAAVAGDRVVALQGDGKVMTWQLGDRTIREEWRLTEGGVLGVTLAKNGEVAAIIDQDGAPRVFNLRAGPRPAPIRAPSKLVNLKLSADGRLLAGVGQDKHARIWDLASGHELYDFLMMDPTASDIDLSLDGKQFLASRGSKGTLLVLYQAGQKEPKVLNDRENTLSGGFNMLQGVFSPDGKLGAVADAGSFINLFDTITGKGFGDLKSRSRPARLVFSPDSKQIAVGEMSGLITLWRFPGRILDPSTVAAVEGGSLQTDAGPPIKRHLKGHMDAIEALAFTPDGQKLVSISRDNTARCWELDDREESRVLYRGRGQIDALSYSPDGRYIVEASMEDGIRVHDLKSTSSPRTLATHGSRKAVFSPDGRTIAAAPAHRVTLWDAKNWAILGTVGEAEPAEVGALAYSRDGHWLLVGVGDPNTFSTDTGGKVVIIDVPTRKEFRTIDVPTQVSAVTFSADGKLAAAAGHDGTVWLWDTSSWVEVARWQAPVGTKYASILFLPGDIELATGGHSGKIDIWNVTTAKQARHFHGHIDCVSFMALSGDGRTLATSSWDRSIKLWDSGTGRELRTLYRADKWMYTVAFSPEGNTLASGGIIPGLRLWEASSQEEVDALSSGRE
jgi:serine/threonine protein kinase/WD40 repeat protein